MKAGLYQTVTEILDARLMRYRGIGIRFTGRGLCGVCSAQPVYVEELFCPGVIGFEVFVRDGPRGGHAIVMAQLLEVFLAQADVDEVCCDYFRYFEFLRLGEA